MYALLVLDNVLAIVRQVNRLKLSTYKCCMFELLYAIYAITTQNTTLQTIICNRAHKSVEYDSRYRSENLR